MAPNIENGTHVRLNDGGLMPLAGLGCWQASDEEISKAVKTALNAGYRLLDTAYNYQNEKGVGDGIKMWGGEREDVYVVTKLPLVGMSGDKVEYFLKKSLESLGLDYVDLYLIHTPIGLKYVDDINTFPENEDGSQLLLDYSTNHEALWKEMEAVQALGLARSIGVSNFSTGQLRRLVQVGNIPPAVNQVEMHVEFQQNAMQRYCNEVGITLMSFGTLGSPGRVGTPFELGCTIPSLLQHPVVGVVASLNGITPAQVLLRFFVQKGIVVIPKSTNKDRITANIKVLELKLSEQSMAAIRTLERGEKSRSFNFLNRRGMELHPECPVNIPEEF